MQNKYLKILLIALIIAFIVPQITLAAWYNPFSWHFWGNFWNYFFHKQTPVTQQVPLTSGTLRNATITYPNPYDTSKNDTFTLSGGHAIIYDAGNIKPRAYDVAATAVGNLNSDGMAEGVIGIYQGYGANIIVPIVFVFSDKNGVLTQIDSVLPDASIWNSETQIKSISINNGVLSVNLLVLAEKDQSLPHYQQQASIAKTVQYKLIDGKLILQPTDQTAGWKTFVGVNVGVSFSFEYPSSWTYQKVSCNLDYIAFCPLVGNSPSNCGMTCAMNSPNASIYLYTFQGSPAIGVASQNIKYWAEPNASLNLWDNKYKEIYTEMISTFKFITPTDQTAGWKIYTNSQYDFSLSYPSDFANVNDLTATQQNSLQTYMEVCFRNNNNPNETDFCYIGNQTSDGFAAASLNIAASASTTMQDCEKSEGYGPDGEQAQTQPTTINGIIFYNAQLADAGLGHYVSTDSYRTYHGGTCYTIDLNIESDRGVSEKGLSADFSSMMHSKLKSIISTFKFTK